MDFDLLKTMLKDTIPWVQMSGIDAEVLEERHVKLWVPVKEKHLNHVRVVYAGTQFMLMEVSGAALFFCTYGVERFIPINKEMSIRYLKPTSKDIFCELSISEEDANARIKPIEERGKGDWLLDMSIVDAEGTVISTSTCNYYIIPLSNKDFQLKTS